MRNIKTIWLVLICFKGSSLHSQSTIDTAYINRSNQCFNNIYSMVTKSNNLNGFSILYTDCIYELDSTDYVNLSYYEKAIHAIYFPEICNYLCFRVIKLHVDTQKYIYNSIIDLQSNNYWSLRQNTFIKNATDSLLDVLKMELSKPKNNEIIYKFIYKNKLVNLLPQLIQNYHLTNNTLNLTLMLLFMKEAKFQPFISSKLYKKFYGNKNTYNIEFTSKLETEILKQTQLFIKMKKLD